jgi:hypothetical protein
MQSGDTMTRTIMTALSLLLFSTIAMAGTLEITCKNPRQSYAVTFDDMTRTFTVSAPGTDAPYMVESVETGKDRPVVKGQTVKGGPGFVAYLGGKKRIER